MEGEYENDLEYSLRLTSSVYIPLDLTRVQDSYRFLQDGDTLSFTLTFGNAEPITFQSSSSEFGLFKNLLDSEYIHQEGESIAIDLTINKSQNSNKISIYHFDTFISNLEQLTAEQAFAIFDRILSRGDSITFYVFNLSNSFSTESLHFLSPGSSSTINDFTLRQALLDSSTSVSNYTNSNIHRLLPGDFALVTPESQFPKLKNIFNRFSTLLSVLYLFDITSLEGNVLKYKLNGYKSISGKVDVTSFLEDTHHEYYEIYKWVFTGGNLNDKVGLARNIISLHLANSGSLGLNGEPLASIQSGFKVYEKQNIKQYIEIRNRISDQLLDFNNRANKVIETFAGGFQKSSLALITFYFSAIAIKVFGKGDFENVFSPDITLLSITFIVGSFLYFLIARWEVIAQRTRFVNSYTNLKARYTDILVSADINRILNNDKEYTEDLKFINDKLCIYTLLWLIILGLLLIVTFCLYFSYILS